MDQGILNQNLIHLKDSLMILKSNLRQLNQKLEILKVNLPPNSENFDEFIQALKSTSLPEFRNSIDKFKSEEIFEFLTKNEINEIPPLNWMIDQILESKFIYPPDFLEFVMSKILHSLKKDVLSKMYKKFSTLPIYFAFKAIENPKNKNFIPTRQTLIILMNNLLDIDDTVFVQENILSMSETIIKNMFKNFSPDKFKLQKQFLAKFLSKIFTDKPLMKDCLIMKSKEVLDTVPEKLDAQKNEILKLME